MIKFFLLIFTTIALYLIFSIIGEYDSDVHIEFLNYLVSIRGFFLIIAIFTSYLIFAIIIKLLSFLLNAPSIISKLVKDSRLKQSQKKLIESYAMLISGNEKGSYDLINKIKKDLSPEFAIDKNLILSITEKDDEARLCHLKYLLDSNEYRNFASYELSKYFFKHQYYQQSLEYSKNLTNPEKSLEILNLLIELSIKMNDWYNFEENIVKMKHLSEDAVLDIKDKLAEGYFMAAKDSVGSQENSRAVYYLEQTLSYKPDLLEAIELLCYLNNNNGKTKLNRKIIETAFTISPSFDLFLIYIKSNQAQSAKQIYSHLASLADPRNNVDVFLAIASYLDIKQEVQDLKASVIE